MRASLSFLAGAVAVVTATAASAQTLEEFLRDPRLEQPIPICLIDPRFCDPGQPSLSNWQPRHDLDLSWDEFGRSSMNYSENEIIVLDPSRVFVGVGGVYLVPEGVQEPFISRW